MLWGCNVSRQPEVPRAKSPVTDVVATVVLLIAFVVVLFLVANWGDWTSALQEDVAEIPRLAAAQQQAQQGTGSESLLLVVMDREEKTGAIAVAASVDGQPSSLTLIPTLLFELLPGYGYFPLGEAVGFEGPDLARIAVSNALGVRIDRVVVVPASHLSALQPPLRLDVELSEPVIEQRDEAS